MGIVLSINAGSSSIKCAAYEIGHSASELTPLASASIENIGQPDAVLLTGADDETLTPLAAPDHMAAMTALYDWLGQKFSLGQVSMIGHRVVHGGTAFSGPTVLDQPVVDKLHELQKLDPDHMPGALAAMSVTGQKLPGVPQVACFDTAFFTDIPKVASIIPLPKTVRDKGVKRYGFHGLSYTYLLESFRAHEGEAAARGRIIMAHLGSGASLAAVKDGRAVDMTMGFTPASGIPMSTRSGSIDPGLALYLHRTLGLSAKDFDHILNKASGLLGVSETTADMHTLLQTQSSDPRAAQAIELFCYEVSKAIGALAATIDGVNSIIFAGGIGERSAEIRRRVCAKLTHLGVKLDDAQNQASNRCISATESDVGVHVIHTDESIIIAKQTLEKLKETDDHADQ